MKNTFVDEKGEYGEQGQEYLFHPGKDKEKQGETRQKPKKTRDNTGKNTEPEKNTKQAGLPTKTEEETEEEQGILFKGKNA